jgi:hypothetical protein
MRAVIRRIATIETSGLAESGRLSEFRENQLLLGSLMIPDSGSP